MKRFNTQYDRITDGPQQFTQPSLTEPDMHMSVQTIYARFAQGLPLTRRSDAVFTLDDFTPDIKGLDLAEVEALYKKAAGDVERYKNDYEKLRAKHDADVKEAAEQRRKDAQSMQKDAASKQAAEKAAANE